jgi:hypothetical protein
MSDWTPPLLSVIIPTCGRNSLVRTLQSIRGQVGDDDKFIGSDKVEVLVIGDTHDGTFNMPLSGVPSLCQNHSRHLSGVRRR